MKLLLSLLIASVLPLHAESEKEFCERVAKACNSKNAAEILALYGDPSKLDPDFKNQITTGMIDFISPTPDTESLTVEITKGMETKPVFKKTVNTFKGAIIQIESVTH